jgi:hypothetical protein
MNTTEQIILVILAAALIVFIIVAIVVVVALIRLLKTLQLIANKAEHFVDSAEAVGSMVGRTVGRLSLFRFVKMVIDLVASKDKKKGD